MDDRRHSFLRKPGWDGSPHRLGSLCEGKAGAGRPLTQLGSRLRPWRFFIPSIRASRMQVAQIRPQGRQAPGRECMDMETGLMGWGHRRTTASRWLDCGVACPDLA